MQGEKSMLAIDFSRYDCKLYQEYQEKVKKIFKYEHIRLVEDKVEMVNKICSELPIMLLGNAEKIRIKSIINIINQLLFVKNDEVGALAYKSKKTRTVRHGKEHYTTAYKFYFVGDEYAI